MRYGRVVVERVEYRYGVCEPVCVVLDVCIGLPVKRLNLLQKREREREADRPGIANLK
jgi:hypothetical protein